MADDGQPGHGYQSGMSATPRIGPKIPPRAYIREHRKDAGLTQQVLADRLGCAKGTISRYENQMRGIDLNVLAAIAEALGRRLNEMFSPPAPKTRTQPQPTPDVRAIAAEVAKLLDKQRRQRRS